MTNKSHNLKATLLVSKFCKNIFNEDGFIDIVFLPFRENCMKANLSSSFPFEKHYLKNFKMTFFNTSPFVSSKTFSLIHKVIFLFIFLLPI